MKVASLLKSFRAVSLLEGISFIILLFIAMPLKYYANSPSAVKYVGMAHGVLFVAFILLAFLYTEKGKKSFKFLAIAVAASFLPFGTFVLDSKILRKDAEALT